ncbi:MAG: ATP-binding cassette domain-containing protein [Phycisphaera sp.]|nr:ATP-binding cassette domain-containing protein [Phycisphaera sp.]
MSGSSQVPSPVVQFGAKPAVPPLMQMRDVRFAYHPDRPVIDGVSLDLKARTLVALIGPNGSGKTTLLKLLLGTLTPSAGRVELRNRSVRSLAPSKRAAWVSYVPQKSAAAFSFTVREVVAMGRYALPADPHAVEGALGLCELLPLASRPYTELSAGQQQRVLLARAMVQSAGQGRVMLLDEPTGAMDLSYVHKTMRRLRELAEQGMAVVTVVQDVNLAARYADHVWVMHQGRLVADGPWPRVLCPEVLEPVYGVAVRPIAKRGEDANARPVFDVDLRG